MTEFTISQTASPQEAAAIAAAIQRFTADTAVAPPAEPAGMDPWLKAALEEGVSAKEVFGPGQPLGTF
jgi:hypothetical protein